jgi:biopolymer transport protein ExbD
MSSKKEEQIGLQATSLVDVLFILLIFFLMVSQVRPSSIQVQLPQVEKNSPSPSSPPEKPPKVTVITLNKEGKLYLGNTASSLSELKYQLSELWRLEGKTSAITIRSDEEAPSGILVQLLNSLSEIGFTQIDIATQHP